MSKKAHGFTIVELLIVIVVIAILAAISIVAYNGIQDRAKTTSALTAAKQAATKITLYLTDNPTPPSDLTTLDITPTPTTTYQYRTGSPSPDSWCLTATTSNKSAYTSNTQLTPTSGACPGHGVNGVAAITNLAVDPNMTSIVGVNNAGAPGTNTLQNNGGYSGATYIRRTFSGTGANGIWYNNTTPITPGITYTLSVWVRTSKATTIRAGIDWRTPAGAYAGGGSTASVATSSGGWTRLTDTRTAPAGVAFITPTIYNPSSVWTAGDWLDVDAMMITEGTSVYTFADGSSAGWDWNGTANSSTSSGPAL